MYIARDYNEQLYLHFSKPKRNGFVWLSPKYVRLDDKLFPEVTWQNNFQEIQIIKK